MRSKFIVHKFDKDLSRSLGVLIGSVRIFIDNSVVVAKRFKRMTARTGEDVPCFRQRIHHFVRKRVPELVSHAFYNLEIKTRAIVSNQYTERF